MDAVPVKSPEDANLPPRALPTGEDVARRANVSRATVSYVLNGVTSQKISQKTREAVHRAADELGYRPNPAAQSLAAGASRIALLVMPGVHLGELFIEVSSLLTARAAERGVTLIVHIESPASRTVIDVAQDLRPRAVFSMFGLDEQTVSWLRERGIPVASLRQDSGDSVTANDRSGWLQVHHLADHGHSRIGFADTDDPGLRMVAESRRDDILDACRQHGLPTPLHEQFGLDGHDAAEKVRRWVEAGVTAVAAYNDEVAITVLAGIRRAGLRCPEDLAVIGVDEMAINGSMDPPLSSIEFDMDNFGLLYADALSAMLDGRASSPRELVTDDLMRVVERASTAGSPLMSFDPA